MENVVTYIALIIEIIALVYVIRNIKEDIKVYKTLNDINNFVSEEKV